MFVFCGDSHARQFRTDKTGVFATLIASGATMKGLANPDSEAALADMILHMARLQRPKTIFIMVGGVDLDFSYYRALCLDGAVDDAAWAQERIDAYNQFLGLLLNDPAAAAWIEGVRVLAPHATPLRDKHFELITCKTADIPADAFARAAAGADFSHATRNRRILAFNDRLEAALLRHPKLKFLRIDREMLDEDGEIEPRFYSAKARDHHASQAETLLTWSVLLDADIPNFQRHVERAQMRAKAAAANVKTV
jgi:hypothetical protein